MNPAKFARFGTAHQTSWDWRAAGNFICGGAGASLLALTVLVGYPAQADGWLLLASLLLIGGGLTFVWTEIGRPWRAFNVLFHPQTSWMTREAWVAALIVALAGAAAATGIATLSHAAGLAGLLFLYCQGRILRAARGIPAWRAPAVLPLIMSTGLVEGMSLLIVVETARQHVTTAMIASLLALVVLRAAVWGYYRGHLLASDAPPSTRRVLQGIHRVLLGAGTLLPLASCTLGLSASAGSTAATAATMVAAGAAGVAGWHLKLLLITRAAQVQGYALGNKLRRGHPLGLTAK